MIVLLLLMMSPIAYTLDMVPAGLKTVLMLNPLYYYIISYQDLMMGNQFPRQSVLLIGLALGAVHLLGGLLVFH